LPAATVSTVFMTQRFDNAIRGGLLFCLVFTALAHGAVEPWSVAIFELIIIALIFLWVIRSVAHGEIAVKVPAEALPIAALIVIGLVQSIAHTDSAGRRIGLSMDVEATRRVLPVLFCLFVAFILSSNFFTTRKQLRMLGAFLSFYGLTLSVFAIIQNLTWNGRFYWVRHTSGTSVFGPFANRNHFAGYIEMLVMVPVALIITRGVRKEVRGLYGFAAVFMGTAVLLSLSRGGTISLAAGMIFLALVSVRMTRKNGLKASNTPSVLKRVGAIVLIAVAIILVVMWVGAEDVINRASDSLGPENTRGLVWRDTWAMIRQNPIVGVGLGAFETAYPIYGQTDGRLAISYAHNDYLQVLADTGFVGGLIALWFLLMVFRALVRAMKSSDPLLAGLAAGCGGGLVSILVHSLLDFNLQIPSNALLFLFLLAVVSRIALIVDESKNEKAVSRAVHTNKFSA
jgi:O-antigen ligase